MLYLMYLKLIMMTLETHGNWNYSDVFINFEHTEHNIK